MSRSKDFPVVAATRVASSSKTLCRSFVRKAWKSMQPAESRLCVGSVSGALFGSELVRPVGQSEPSLPHCVRMPSAALYAACCAAGTVDAAGNEGAKSLASSRA